MVTFNHARPNEPNHDQLLGVPHPAADHVTRERPALGRRHQQLPLPDMLTATTSADTRHDRGRRLQRLRGLLADPARGIRLPDQHDLGGAETCTAHATVGAVTP
ncbi:hypothetical protein [Pseudonocardia sp. Ae717_Ps2]|uniref:hypothetical protein n=1 Tax=Pseudonocardia sp. Ae717_Ps2 TaxID=1885573 RepID=UPI00117AE04B|nr:hypothetical protein [Pseudonocardia sp. Ae717_Ps2]